MKVDYKNRKLVFENPGEEIEYNAHMTEYGPGTQNGEHPDDCQFCNAKGWPTWPGTTFEAECDKYREEHPEEFEEE